MGNKWRSRSALRTAQLPMRFKVAVFGFVVHEANFQLGEALCKNYRVRVQGAGRAGSTSLTTVRQAHRRLFGRPHRNEKSPRPSADSGECLRKDVGSRKYPPYGEPSSDTVLIRTSVHVQRLWVKGLVGKFFCRREGSSAADGAQFPRFGSWNLFSSPPLESVESQCDRRCEPSRRVPRRN